MADRPDRIVLACPDGDEAPEAIRWLQHQHAAEVVTVTVDLGAGRQLEAVRDRALAAGALRAHVMDARDEFARDFLAPTLKAGALAGRAALGRPLVAKQLVTIAAIEHAAIVAYASRAALPMGRLIQALNPALRTVQVSADISSADGDAARRAAAPSSREPAIVEIAFDRGMPAAVNGIAMPFVELVGSLATIGSAHGVCESTQLLQAAHQAVQSRVTDRHLAKVMAVVTAEYAALIEDGRWFTPLRGALDALVEQVQQRVVGVARVRLHNAAWAIA